jgi:predicted nucleic acid-binding protein
MIVVSDTSPLNYLVVIGQQELLPSLFGRVILPTAVARELSHPLAPPAVQAWIAKPPTWCEIRTPQTIQPIGLGLGERQAISLAAELKADLLLVDDRAARRAAIQRGLAITGTLGVLELAAARHLIDLPTVIDALRRTDYQIAKDLVRDALARDARRRR